jgi:protein-S-isoprenylcysteine O-methyltransferase Ste14
MFIRKLIVAVTYNLVIYGTALFGIAGTFDWWRAWMLLAAINMATIWLLVAVLRPQPELLEDRFKGIIQRGQPWSDRAIVLAFIVGYATVLILTPLDVWRLHLLPTPGIVISTLGLVLTLVAYWIVGLAFKENTFAVPVIKHQNERHHVVVDTGVYAKIRHPIYLGVILLSFGIPLWLESYAGALAALFPAVMLMLRSLVEERFLCRELAGYDAYSALVRYRLVPYVW